MAAEPIFEFEGELISRSALNRSFAVREPDGQIRELAELFAEHLGGRHLKGTAWHGRVRVVIEPLEESADAD